MSMPAFKRCTLIAWCQKNHTISAYTRHSTLTELCTGVEHWRHAPKVLLNRSDLPLHAMLQMTTAAQHAKIYQVEPCLCRNALRLFTSPKTFAAKGSTVQVSSNSRT